VDSTEQKGAGSGFGRLLWFVSGVVIVCAPIALLASGPAWWSDPTLTTSGTPVISGSASDFAVANQGQLKNMAVTAVKEFNTVLPGGAGSPLNSLAVSLTATSGSTSDFSAVNLGQLKAVAKPFYDQLFIVDYEGPPIFTSGTYPWTTSGLTASDFSAANLGQVKNLFSFDFTYTSGTNPLPTWWRKSYFGTLSVSPTAFVTWSGSLMTTGTAYALGLDPIDYYDGTLPNLSIYSGNSQSGFVGSILSYPLVVSVTTTGSGSHPLDYAPVVFTVSSGSGGLASTGTATSLAPSTTALTNSSGYATVYWEPLESGTSQITATATSGTASTSVTFSETAAVVFSSSTAVLWGQNQQGLPGQFLSDPFVVQVTGTNQQPVSDAQVTFSVTSGGGGLTTNEFSAPVQTTGTVTTGTDGIAMMYYQQSGTSEVTSAITVSGSSAGPAVFYAKTVSAAPIQSAHLAAGDPSSVADSDGGAWSWGDNFYPPGELGDGSTVLGRFYPTAISGTLSIFSVATGVDGLALSGSGCLYEWGYDYGSPTLVPGISGVTAVSCQNGLDLAVTSDGSLWAWDPGSNDPSQVSGLSGVVSAASGGTFNLALENNGSVWAWGTLYPSLGDGSTVTSSTPIEIPSLSGSGIIAVSAGGDFAAALTSGGQVLTWGSNDWGQLGISGSLSVSKPQAVVGATNVIAISAGHDYMIALKSNGTVLAWGDDQQGQLGIGISGTLELSGTPVQVQGLTKIIDISADFAVNLALQDTGAIWTWGSAAATLANGTGYPQEYINFYNYLYNGGDAYTSFSTTTSVSVKPLLLMNDPAYAGVAPANDNLAAAMTMTVGGSDSEDTTSATVEPNEAFTDGIGTECIGRTIWYKVTTGSQTSLIVTATSTAFYPLIHVFSSSTSSMLVPLFPMDHNPYVPGSRSFLAQSGSTYFIQVGGEFGACGEVTTAINDVAPTTPSGVTAVALSGSENMVSWNAQSGDPYPTTYQIYRSNGGGSWVLVGTSTNAETFVDASLGASGISSYEVQVVEFSATSSLSGTASVDQTHLIAGNLPVNGMKLWLTGDTLSVSDSTVWYDLSGNANNGVLQQESPPYTFQQMTETALNGKPAVNFTGSQIFSLPSFLSGTGAGEMLVVVKSALETGTQTPWSFDEYFTTYSGYPGSNGRIQETFGNDSQVMEAQPTAPLTNYHVYDVSSSSTGFREMWLDSVPLASATATGWGFRSLAIGGPINYGYQPFQGDFAEVIVYGRVLSNAERMAARAYLDEKYALVTAAPGAPSDLCAVAMSGTQNLVTWTDSNSVTDVQYQVWRQSGGGPSVLAGTTVNTCTFFDNGVEPDTGYTYQVSAVNGAGTTSGTGGVVVSDYGPLYDSVPTNGMALWLMGDGAWGGSYVRNWHDFSGNGNDAWQNPPYATGTTDAPTLVTNALNGRPVMHFDATKQQTLALPQFLAGDTNAEMFVVVRSDTTGATNVPWTFNPPQGYPPTWGASLYSASNGNVVETFGDVTGQYGVYSAQPTADLTQYHVYEVSSSDTGHWEMWLDGVSQFTTYTNVAGFTGSITLGGSDAGEIESGGYDYPVYAFFTGDIAEMIIYNRVLTKSEKEAVRRYVGIKYLLPGMDVDGDGLTTGTDIADGLDPLNPDVNGDGLTNGEDMALGISATNDYLIDNGLTNAQNIALGIDLFSPYTPFTPPSDPTPTEPPVITLLLPANAVPDP